MSLLKLEPLFQQSSKKLSLFPINPNFSHLYDQYKKLEANYWVVGEIDFQGDSADWDKLDNDTKTFIENTLSFFAGGDTIVGEGAERLYMLFDQPEIRAFYAYQIYNETVHGETYSLLIENLIKNKKRQQELFNSFETMPHIQKLYLWAKKWVKYDIDDEFLENKDLNPEVQTDRDLAFLHSTYKFIAALASFECIGFASSFASIFWIKERGILNALTQSNLLISKDESAHFSYACSILNMFVHKPNPNVILEMVIEIVEASKEFINESIDKLLGMNKTMMNTYIEFVADGLLLKLGLNKYYNVGLPAGMEFMNKLNFDDMNNMFEKKSTNYALASGSINDSILTDDF